MNQFAGLSSSMPQSLGWLAGASFAPQHLHQASSHENHLDAFGASRFLAAQAFDSYPNRKRKSNEASPGASLATGFACKTLHKEKKIKQSRTRPESSEEVIHVRARRGGATDSHSLAERVRREKINKKIRCLQELVPGCNKTMGMAATLEEIINYVHSLQNQVEFLSMEIASAFSSASVDPERDLINKTTAANPFGYAKHNQMEAATTSMRVASIRHVPFF